MYELCQGDEGFTARWILAVTHRPEQRDMYRDMYRDMSRSARRALASDGMRAQPQKLLSS
jgi:hypothetical protein